MKHWKSILVGSAVGLAAGSAVALALANGWVSRPYTSTAVLRSVPATIPESFVPAQRPVELGRVAPMLMGSATSRANLERLINVYDLYASERGRMPLDDVIERMRDAVRLEPADPGSVRISFSYPDQTITQKVTADLVSRMITEYTRYRTSQAVVTVQFLRDRLQRAASEWDERLAAVRAAEPSGKSLARARLDADIAKHRYESLSAKVAEAEMVAMMERRAQGGALYLLDPASLPRASYPRPEILSISGLLAGGVLGWLISAGLAMHRRKAVQLRADMLAV